MTSPIEATTLRALTLALDASSLRQQVIATNIANVDTEGYVPMRVDFESQLGRAREAMSRQGRVDDNSLDGVTPRIEVDRSTGGRVLLDVQVAEMARNAVTHQALVRGISRQFSIYALAVSDGKK